MDRLIRWYMPLGREALSAAGRATSASRRCSAGAGGRAPDPNLPPHKSDHWKATNRSMQRVAPPIPTYTPRPPSYNGVGQRRRCTVSALGRSGRRPIPPDTPADRSTSLSLTQRLSEPQAHPAWGSLFLASPGFFVAGSIACGHQRFRRETADPLDKRYGRIDNCCKQGRAFPPDVWPFSSGACLRKAIAVCIEDAGPGRARTCGSGVA
jgi:hypothetical protein